VSICDSRIRPPLPQRALVGLLRRALSPIASRITRPSLPAPLACVAATCVVRSLVIRPLPITIGHATDPAMAVRAHLPWRVRSSPAKPRAPTSVTGAGGAQVSWLDARSHPNGRNRLAQPFLLYVAYVCFKCFRHFICML
jgi:hypothetical protein